MTERYWGYGVIGGVTFNLPSLGAGADVKFQGAYNKGSFDQSGMVNNNTVFTWASNIGWNGGAGDEYYDWIDNKWIQTEVWSVAARSNCRSGRPSRSIRKSPTATIRRGHGFVPVEEPDRVDRRRGVRVGSGTQSRVRPRPALCFGPSGSAGRMGERFGHQRVEVELRRLQRQAAHHPHLLIAQRSVANQRPRSASSGAFCCVSRRVWRRSSVKRQSACPLMNLKHIAFGWRHSRSQ